MIETLAIAVALAVGVFTGVRVSRRQHMVLVREARASQHRTRTELADVRADRDALRIELADARRLCATVVSVTEMLIEPETSDACRKVRLRSEPEAFAFARRVESDTPGLGELAPYRCQRCPRQPVSLERFWHVSHVDPSLRGARYYNVVTANSVKRRVSPQALANLAEKRKWAA